MRLTLRNLSWLGCLFALSFALSSESALADIVHFRVTDPTGAPFPNALVILKALYDGHEVSRALTDKEGKVAEAILPRGLYRVIAAYPYALWKTDVREFLTGENPVEITLTLQALGTQDNVAFVGAPSLLIEVLEGTESRSPGPLSLRATYQPSTKKATKRMRQAKQALTLYPIPLYWSSSNALISSPALCIPAARRTYRNW